MNQSAFTYKEHEIISTLLKEEAMKLFDSLMEKHYTITDNFKDNRKCLVQKIKIDGFDEMVFKIPRSRSKRKWERMVTLVRDSEAFRNHKSMLTLQTLGLRGANPILAAQRRIRGIVLESFFTYSFVEGEAPKEEETPKVLEVMNLLHAQGYTRSDPKLQNFIMHKGEVYFIDFRLKKPRFFSKMERTLNLCKFFQTLPNDKNYMSTHQQNSLFFKAMYQWHRVLMFWRSTRQKIKKILRKF